MTHHIPVLIITPRQSRVEWIGYVVVFLVPLADKVKKVPTVRFLGISCHRLCPCLGRNSGVCSFLLVIVTSSSVIASPSPSVILREWSDQRIWLRVNSAKQSWPTSTVFARSASDEAISVDGRRCTPPKTTPRLPRHSVPRNDI